MAGNDDDRSGAAPEPRLVRLFDAWSLAAPPESTASIAELGRRFAPKPAEDVDAGQPSRSEPDDTFSS